MRDKQGDILTDRQARVVRAMTHMPHTYHLAADIARRAEVDNRGIGAVLSGLYSRGVVERRSDSWHPSAVYEWRLV